MRRANRSLPKRFTTDRVSTVVARPPSTPTRRSGVEVRPEATLRPTLPRGEGASSGWGVLWRELKKGIASLASQLDATFDNPSLEPVRAYATRYLRHTGAVFEALICLVEDARESAAGDALAFDAALTRCIASVYDWSTRLTGEVEEALREEGEAPGELVDLARHLAEFSAIEVRGFVQPRIAEARALLRQASARDAGLLGLTELLDRLEGAVVDLNWELRSSRM